jgi:hypothetical protein
MMAFIALSLLCLGLTGFYLLAENIQSYVESRNRCDILGAVMSLIMGVWFCFAAFWLYNL